MEQYITDSQGNGGIMAASWKHIDKVQTGNRVTQINALRVDTNSRDEEFSRDVVIFVGIPEQEDVSNMTDSELQTYVENHVDMSLLDDGIATDELPTQEE
jgi:hypothetical protein